MSEHPTHIPESAMKMDPVETSEKTLSEYLSGEYMQRFLKTREIKPEDYSLIEKFSAFRRGDIVEFFHNYFTSARDQTRDKLEKDLVHWKTMDSKERVQLGELFLEVAKRYEDWTVVYALETMLEVANPKFIPQSK